MLFFQHFHAVFAAVLRMRSSGSRFEKNPSTSGSVKTLYAVVSKQRADFIFIQEYIQLIVKIHKSLLLKGAVNVYIHT